MTKIIYLKDGENSKSQLIIDGEQVDSSNYGLDSNIHAIQWEGSKGEIEYNDGTPNKEITDISSFDLETKHATEKKANADAIKKEEEDYLAKMTYADKRSAEYPDIGDQLDDIYHNGIDGWKSTIKAVKDKYPKS
tara:strand:- start:85 stop:489 length:405 start_codon:yes stop_codon:yes gene_type:complete